MEWNLAAKKQANPHAGQAFTVKCNKWLSETRNADQIFKDYKIMCAAQGHKFDLHQLLVHV